MQRLDFKLPLLIGGATTSPAHTAVKIALNYKQPVVHVVDASRAVGIVGHLINPKLKSQFAEKNSQSQEKLRQQHSSQRLKLLSIDEARRRAPKFALKDLAISQPEFVDVRKISSDEQQKGAYLVKIEDLVACIDWSPFFHTWELRGRYPAILQHEKHGAQARELFADAQKLLEQIVNEKLLAARGVYGFFPASSDGDDVVLYTDESRNDVLTTFRFLRQQIEKTDGQPNWCLADFVADKSGRDYIGAFAVTAGLGLDELVIRYKSEHDDYNAIMAEALADRLAEAFAEYLHRRVRSEWGYGKNENLTAAQLIDGEYRGIRPAAGYPACPDHTEKRTLWQLLDAEKNAGIRLTESFAMWPGSSVSGLYFGAPQSKYFAVGKLGRDQVLDYHRRKGMTLPVIERWLGPYLNYEP
jgi:5-methyltetrahydrofolate--homocysteine methyltransferase